MSLTYFFYFLVHSRHAARVFPFSFLSSLLLSSFSLSPFLFPSIPLSLLSFPSFFLLLGSRHGKVLGYLTGGMSEGTQEEGGTAIVLP